MLPDCIGLGWLCAPDCPTAQPISHCRVRCSGCCPCQEALNFQRGQGPCAKQVSHEEEAADATLELIVKRASPSVGVARAQPGTCFLIPCWISRSRRPKADARAWKSSLLSTKTFKATAWARSRARMARVVPGDVRHLPCWRKTMAQAGCDVAMSDVAPMVGAVAAHLDTRRAADFLELEEPSRL